MNDWSQDEVTAIVADYMTMLAAELAGVPYNKTQHRQALQKKLSDRSAASIEFKHANISAILVEAGFPYISGYKPRSNYQRLIVSKISEYLSRNNSILDIAASDADRPMAVPEIDDILSVLTKQPKSTNTPRIAESTPTRIRLTTNYLEREARNRSLGTAGELFVINYERARLISLGKEALASRIEHTARVQGDSAGFDVMSFEESGEERFIEVKTTKYGSETPFFVSDNEVEVSKKTAYKYQLYRLFDFRTTPGLYTLTGPIPMTCLLSATTFMAYPR